MSLIQAAIWEQAIKIIFPNLVSYRYIRDTTSIISNHFCFAIPGHRKTQL